MEGLWANISDYDTEEQSTLIDYEINYGIWKLDGVKYLIKIMLAQRPSTLVLMMINSCSYVY